MCIVTAINSFPEVSSRISAAGEATAADEEDSPGELPGAVTPHRLRWRGVIGQLEHKFFIVTAVQARTQRYLSSRWLA